MNAEIMAVGTELLLGDIVNTNAQYLAKELALLGFGIYRQTTVGDNEVRLETALKEALKEADIVITTGGLGPTPDDITKLLSDTLKKVVQDPEVAKRMKSVGAYPVYGDAADMANRIKVDSAIWEQVIN